MSTAESPLRSDRLPLIMMGVSGCGKTTLGRELGQALGLPFVDGDDLHSSEARAKMAAGVALDDADRAPWLDRIGAALADAATWPKGGIIACSALRRAYRDRLRAIVGDDLRFVFLEWDKAVIWERVNSRADHYMPASLVDSQFAALEPPVHESDVVTISSRWSLADAMQESLRKLAALPLVASQGKETA